MTGMKKNQSGLSGQLKEKLIQKSLERKIKSFEKTVASENNLQAISFPHKNNNVPEAFYRFDRMPAYQNIKLIHNGAERLGLVNPFFRTHDGLAGAHTKIASKELINFSSYNYLDLSGDTRVNDAAKTAIDCYGTSVSASRLVSGERPIHRELEREIARIYGTDDSIIFVSGHATNVSTIGQLFGPRDLILHDEFIHNSVLQGCQLSGAKRFSFSHNNWKALESLLEQHRQNFERVLIAIEGLYSMDGDFPDLPKFIELKERHHAFLMVDEAHSFGVIGTRGFGLREHFSLDGSEVDIWMGTLSKSLAGCGGYVTGSTALVEQLKFLASGFLYSVGMSPPLAAASLVALQCMIQEPERVKTLQQRGQYFIDRAKTTGIDTGTSAGLAIIPVIIGSSVDATRLSAHLMDRGINVQPIIYPAVPEKLARLRFFLSCRHTETEIDYTIDTLAQMLRNKSSQ